MLLDVEQLMSDNCVNIVLTLQKNNLSDNCGASALRRFGATHRAS